jgi:hypothetical protein
MVQYSRYLNDVESEACLQDVLSQAGHTRYFTAHNNNSHMTELTSLEKAACDKHSPKFLKPEYIEAINRNAWKFLHQEQGRLGSTTKSFPEGVESSSTETAEGISVSHFALFRMQKFG